MFIPHFPSLPISNALFHTFFLAAADDSGPNR
jgi:hypothetical protein